jgi:hypothetical protein
MGNIKEPQQVKCFCGLLLKYIELEQKVRGDLIKSIGEIDFVAGPIEWNFTDYYQKKMGGDLKKYLYSFKDLISPESIADIKVRTNRIEEHFANEEATEEVPRPVNLDPGYITTSSMILASTKPYSHRIYLKSGIYAQVDYLFKAGDKVEFTPWVYPDYKTDKYLDFFLNIRKKLLNELRRI